MTNKFTLNGIVQSQTGINVDSLVAASRRDSNRQSIIWDAFWNAKNCMWLVTEEGRSILNRAATALGKLPPGIDPGSVVWEARAEDGSEIPIEKQVSTLSLQGVTSRNVILRVSNEYTSYVTRVIESRPVWQGTTVIGSVTEYEVYNGE